MIQVFDGDGVEHRIGACTFTFEPVWAKVNTSSWINDNGTGMDRIMLMRFDAKVGMPYLLLTQTIDRLEKYRDSGTPVRVQVTHDNLRTATYGRIIDLRNAALEDLMELWIKMTVEDG